MRPLVVVVAASVAAAAVAAAGALFLPAGLEAVPVGWRVVLILIALYLLARVVWMLITAAPYLPLAVFEANPGRHRAVASCPQ
jgi:hypothetical protein